LFSLFVCAISTFGGSSTSTDIECSDGDSGYSAEGSIYCCEGNNDSNIITEESAQINGINGTHEISKSNNYAPGFFASFKNC